MTNPIAHLLEQQDVLILDGALATELERRGAKINHALWSAKILLESPQLIKTVHHDYFLAGADVAISASYQATLEGFVRYGLETTEARQTIASAVRLACEARDEFAAHSPVGRLKPLVAASVGPYGAYLADGSEYRGDYGVGLEQLMDFHRERIGLLVAAGADLLACETIPCWLEAEAILRLLPEFPSVGAWFSFSAQDASHTSAGEDVLECARRLEQHPQVLAVGINCTAPEFITPLLRRLRQGTTKPLLTYPNSGERYDVETRTWIGEGCADFATQAKAWRAAGASLIGGCCRTGPEHVRAIREALLGT